MIALPIPDRRSPVRYRDLVWQGRNLGEVVATLTGDAQRADHRAHLDPDLRASLLPRLPGWRAALGQIGSAQGHLRKQSVAVGDLFVFWGLFRSVDAKLRWVGRPEHRVWGWLQVGSIAPVDAVVRAGGTEWQWASGHPHLAFSPDSSNTLYVAAKRLSLPGHGEVAAPGWGTFDCATTSRRLTATGAKSPSEWSLPASFLPRGRSPLSYHGDLHRWSESSGGASLRAVSRGQEFVLDLDRYPDVLSWLSGMIASPARS